MSMPTDEQEMSVFQRDGRARPYWVMNPSGERLEPPVSLARWVPVCLLYVPSGVPWHTGHGAHRAWCTPGMVQLCNLHARAYRLGCELRATLSAGSMSLASESTSDTSECVHALWKCVHALWKCVHAMWKYVHAMWKCVHAMWECVPRRFEGCLVPHTPITVQNAPYPQGLRIHVLPSPSLHTPTWVTFPCTPAVHPMCSAHTPAPYPLPRSSLTPFCGTGLHTAWSHNPIQVLQGA